MFFHGIQSFAQPLQEPLSHLILKGFERKIKNLGRQINKRTIRSILSHEIENFNDQMRYPFGQIVMMERNIKSDQETT